jgi:hypothetical protein
MSYRSAERAGLDFVIDQWAVNGETRLNVLDRLDKLALENETGIPEEQAIWMDLLIEYRADEMEMTQ